MNLAAIPRQSFRASHAIFALPLSLAACSDAGPRADEPVAPSRAAQTSTTPIVGYYSGSVPYTSIPFNSLTQINVAFWDIDNQGVGNLGGTPWIDGGSLAQLVSAAHAANVKVLMSVGGSAQDSNFNILTQAGAANLASQMAQFVQNNGLDGADIDWEAVGCSSASPCTCNSSGVCTNNVYQTLIQDLRSDLGSGYLLTAAVDAWGSYYGKVLPDAALGQLNQINVMSYDLEQGASDPNATTADAQTAWSYWQGRVAQIASEGAASYLGQSGINLGIPFFGEAYIGGSGFQYDYKDYKVIYGNEGSAAATNDTYSSGGYVYYYEDIADVQKVTSLAMSNGAGVMIWELDNDNLGQTNSLLTAIANQANPPQGGQGYSCYWMENHAPWSFVGEPTLTYQQCYQKDGCYGGQNGSGGGCYKWATSTSAPPMPWSGDSCYWMENWSPWTFVVQPGMTYDQCYEEDGCYGGLNQSGGGCYKWSSSPTGSHGKWCVPQTCAAQGFTCGQATDGCGGTIQCGGCPSGQVCGATNVCGAGPSQAPLQLWVLPDYDNAKGDLPESTTPIQWFISNTGVKPYGVSNYMNIYQNPSSGTPHFDQSKAEGFIDEARANGVLHVSISLAPAWGDTDESAGLSALQGAVAYGQGKGVTVYVRYGYEMNGSWSPANNNGNPAVFKATWAEVAGAVHAGGGKMVWAPNVNTGGGTAGYQSWLPSDTTTIDVVGFDKYHQNGGPTPDLATSSTELSTAIASIYPVVQQIGKPFILTETGVRYYDSSGWWPVASSAEVTEKQTWLNMVVNSSLRQSYPALVGFGWFDYNKQEGVSDGSTQYCDFSVSQQPLEASMFSAWVAANASSLQLQ